MKRWLILLHASLSAYYSPNLDILCGPDRFSIGPEVYYIEKHHDLVLPEKNEKLTQEGWMYGERISYDRLRMNALYYGADQYYAVGCTDACGRKHPKIQLKDAEVEGRLGYTFSYCGFFNGFLTPIVGYGNYNGQEQFERKKHPFYEVFWKKSHFFDKMKVINRPRFNFVSVGFLSGFFLNECSSIGVNFKAKFMTSGKNKTEIILCKKHHHDEDHKKCKKKIHFCQDMNKRVQYQVDIPMIYHAAWVREEAFEFSVIPFWRLRQYGGRENHPLDFPETSFQMIGMRTMLTYFF